MASDAGTRSWTGTARKALVRAALGAVLGPAAFGPAFADAVPIRAGTHDGYGRIVFAWSQPVPHRAEIGDGRLVVTFEREIEADYAQALRILRRYLKDATPGEGGRSVSFALTGDFGLRTFRNNSAVVVDLLDKIPAAGTASAPAAKKSAADSPRPPSAPAERAERVRVRAGIHSDKTRLVIDWQAPVVYALDRQGDTLTLFFDRPATLELGRIATNPPPRVLAASAESSPASSVLTFAIAPGAVVNHFLAGTRVVVDILAADTPSPVPLAAAPPASVPRATALPPSAPAASAPRAPATSPALSPPAAPAAVAPERPAAQAPPAARAQPLPPPEDAGKPVSLVPGGPEVVIREHDAPAGSGAFPGRSEATGPPVGVTLRFDWDSPTGLAVFRRAGSLWVAFDRPSKPDLERLRAQGGNVVRAVSQVPHEGATFLRLDAVAGINPVPRRDGLSWLLEVYRQPIEAANRLDVTGQPQTRRGRVLIPVSEATTVFALTDPEVGDNLMVVPTLPVSYGMTYPYEFAHFTLLPTGQGVVVRPRTDNLQVRAVPQGIEITSPDGLALSEVPPEAEAQAVFGLNRPLSRALDLDKWRITDSASFVPRRQRLQLDIAKAKPGEERERARLDLIRFFFANGFAAEAIGVIQAAVAERAEVANSAEFRLLRGGTRFLMGRIAEAREDFADKSLDGLDEGLFWRAVVEAVMGDRAQAARELRRVGPIIRFYPRALALPLGLIVAETAIDLGDFKVAVFYLESLLAAGPTPLQRAHIDYLEGRIFELTGDFDKALEKWEAVSKGPDRLARFRAVRDRIELMLKLEQIEPIEAIEALENLRYAWRDDDMEFALLRRLGTLYLEAEDYREGLRTLRQAATYFREHPRAPEVTQQMAEAFARLFLEDEADKLSPVTAIALFEEFRELTPVGARGDEMIRKLADRLTKVDLLDRAAELLRGQVEFRLKGVDRARIGTQLALVYLLDRKPDEALGALRLTDEPGLPPELAAQRLHLRAKALMAKGDGTAALAALKDDRSLDGELLKAEVYWEAQDWERAVQALQRALREAKAEPRKPLTKAQAGYVFNLAVALTLAGNERGVARLRAEYGEAMAQSEIAQGFDLIAGQTALMGLGRADVPAEVKEVQDFQTFL
ncbi:MAG: tetratricopeptide repeat protein, partial [Rhodospirillales bacterium]|nr:tetratricopeptide repeat protein [Rhodospirillales bacterium]